MQQYESNGVCTYQLYPKSNDDMKMVMKRKEKNPNLVT